jgi:hypothetical protein
MRNARRGWRHVRGAASFDAVVERARAAWAPVGVFVHRRSVELVLLSVVAVTFLAVVVSVNATRTARDRAPVSRLPAASSTPEPTGSAGAASSRPRASSPPSRSAVVVGAVETRPTGAPASDSPTPDRSRAKPTTAPARTPTAGSTSPRPTPGSSSTAPAPPPSSHSPTPSPSPTKICLTPDPLDLNLCIPGN